MSNSEDLGLRVSLTGNKEAATGLQGVADAETKVADAAKKVGTASQSAAVGMQKQATTARESTAANTELARSLASGSQNMAGFGGSGGAVVSMLRGLISGATLAGAAMLALGAVQTFSRMQDEARVTLAREGFRVTRGSRPP